MDETIHVMPTNDLKEHLCSSACQCAPRVEQVENGALVIHNSWDGREFFEGDSEDETQMMRGLYGASFE